MGTLNVSFRCVENVQRVLEGKDICYANNLYENTFEISKGFDTPSVDSAVNFALSSRAAGKIGKSLTTNARICKSIRKQLKQLGLPKKIYNAQIVITYMWDEYALAENGSLV